MTKPVTPLTLPGSDHKIRPEVEAATDIVAASAIALKARFADDVLAEAFTTTGLTMFIALYGREKTGEHLMGLALHLKKDEGRGH